MGGIRTRYPNLLPLYSSVSVDLSAIIPEYVHVTGSPRVMTPNNLTEKSTQTKNPSERRGKVEEVYFYRSDGYIFETFLNCQHTRKRNALQQKNTVR